MASAITAADMEEMPQYQRDMLSAWVLDMCRANRSIPGEEERYQAWLAERRAKKANTQERRKTP